MMTVTCAVCGTITPFSFRLDRPCHVCGREMPGKADRLVAA